MITDAKKAKKIHLFSPQRKKVIQKHNMTYKTTRTKENHTDTIKKKKKYMHIKPNTKLKEKPTKLHSPRSKSIDLSPGKNISSF